MGKLMYGEIKRVKGNLRYRILTIDKEYFLIDTGAHLWMRLLPYLFWILRNPGYKIDSQTAFNLISSHKGNPGKGVQYGMIGGGIAISLSGSLLPLVDRTGLGGSLLINLVIAVISLTLIVIFFISFLSNQKKRLRLVIDYTDLPKEQIRISKPNFKHIIRSSFVYLFSLFLSVLFLSAFVVEGNLFILICGLIMVLIFFMVNGLTIDHGNYYIKK
ncbi:hypothetical protein CHH91_02265 [Virgibacillus sp. 7505]|nr:hypothetical protein CHH91_02265 [Virgibacillus sp. 7505]